MRVTALALVLAAVVLAGCGSSKKTEQPNGEASKPANQVLSDAEAAATSASSAHASGAVDSKGTTITVDASLAGDKGAKGSASANGLDFDFVQTGDTVYIHGSDAFYKHFAGSAIAQLLHDRWVKASTSQPQLSAFASHLSMHAIFAEVSSHHGKLVNKGKRNYKGQQVVEIRDMSDGSKLYLAATGKPYPVAIVLRKKGLSLDLAFDAWNVSVSLTAPKDAVDISTFGG